METPLTNHIKPEEYEFVYEPAEDSFLLLDALEKDLPFLEKLNPFTCLEIGSGSGIIITALSKRLKNCFCLSSDINNRACLITKRTSMHNNGFVEPLNMNFSDNLRENIVDVLIFNPPYVVTDNDELSNLNFGNKSKVTDANLVQTWAGGVNGRIVIDALLEKLDGILSSKGVFYLLVLKENKPEDIRLKLSNIGFNSEIFLQRKIPGEHLYILKIIRSVQ